MIRLLGKETPMNKDQMKGNLENLKGKVKEAFGSATGDKRAEGEGMLDRAKGAAQEKVGDAKEALARANKNKNKDDAEDIEVEKDDVESEDE
jgi:uncharacterized protein YjbJ (UPF0337 family)